MKKNQKKIKIALIYGGKSAEHEVSLQSARNIYQALDKNKYEIALIGINKDGSWELQGNDFLLNANDPKLIALNSKKNISSLGKEDIVVLSTEDRNNKIDVVFPILHGSYGEDGTVQGLLKLMSLPFVGPSVLGSALGFDKDVTKRLLSEARIPNTKFVTFRQQDKISYLKVKKILGLPMIVKPANAGSSIGISKVSNEKEFKQAVLEAFIFDTKILIEKFIEGKREIECAVLGNENPKASICGEVITGSSHKFYSYEAKYIDEAGAIIQIPAKIPKNLQREIQNLAVKTFKTLELEGMARVDFFLDQKEKIFVNEVNTIPGFTNISMYPALWQASGISYSELLDQLIILAMERFKREQKLQTSYDK